MVPDNALPPATPLTSHVTVVSRAPVTVACNACVAPTSNDAVVGEIVTLTTATIVTVIETALAGSACGVAVSCTGPETGGSGGAVYTPLEEIVPQSVPVQP